MSRFGTQIDSGMLLNFQYVWARICTILVGRVFDLFVGFGSGDDSSHPKFAWISGEGETPAVLQVGAFPNHLKGFVRWMLDPEIRLQLWANRLHSDELVHPSMLPQAIAMAKHLGAGKDSKIFRSLSNFHLVSGRNITAENVAAFVYSTVFMSTEGDGVVFRRQALELLGMLVSDPLEGQTHSGHLDEAEFQALLDAVNCYCVTLRVFAEHDVA